MDNSKKLIQNYNNNTEWDVCFGAMAILNLDYIKKIFDNTNYFKILISEIKSRNDRICFERIIGLMLSYLIKTKAVNGDIHQDLKYGTNWSSHKKNNNKNKNMYKVWVGREGH